MVNDRWIEALMAPVLLGLLLWPQHGCAVTEKHWHVMRISAMAVGTMHEAQARGDGAWVSVESSLIAFNRMGSRIRVCALQKSVENESHDQGERPATGSSLASS